MNLEKHPLFVHIVSHGPHCLDGIAAAVAIARARPHAEVVPWFAANRDVDETIRQLRLSPNALHEVWITDVSWTDPRTERHLRNLAARGARIHWFDHHRSAVERLAGGEIQVDLAACVVDERHAASRLVFEYLRERLGDDAPKRFRDFWPVVEKADDTDRWIHAVEGSHDLALTVRAMGSIAAYDDLLEIDRHVTFTARMRDAFERVAGDLARSLDAARRSRTDAVLPGGLTLVAAVCRGYPSEIAEEWGRQTANAVFALYDSHSLGISLRRSPDCDVDLSRLARRFGGGGHPAASGCEIPGLEPEPPRALIDALRPALLQANHQGG